MASTLLKDTIFAVTGANGNLGRAVAKAASERGATLALVDALFDAAFPLPNDKATLHRVNLLDAAATRACFEGIGPVDVLCCLAGGFTMGEPVHAADDATWGRMFDLNVKTLVHAVRAVVPGMILRGRGRIVTIGAMAALSGRAMMGPYCAAKSTVIRLTESMAAELKSKGINVNCILPSVIDTPQNRQAMPGTDPSIWVSPADLANVVCFLASDEARAIHGAAIPVTHLT